MAHKVHPKIYRIGGIENWDARWFSKKNFDKYLEEDFRIRNFLKTKLKNAGIQNVTIERFQGKTNVVILSARPGLIIGRGGTGAIEIKKALERELKRRLSNYNTKQALNIEIREVKNPWLSAVLAGQWIAEQIEKRIPFRKTLKQTLEKIMANKEVKGARVEVAGRLDGAEIARTEWLKKGRLPRQTLRADIDYTVTEAHCTYGAVGIKVWIYKGEKFE